jgi:hypothetical protein
MSEYLFYNGDPDRTILHSSINTVKHLFYSLKADETQFMFFYDNDRFDCIVTDIEDNIAKLKVPGFRDKGLRIRTRIHFEVMNCLYHFEVQILRTDSTDVWIRIPHEIHSAKRRKNRRIPTPSLFLHFTILYSPLFGSKSREQEVETRFPFFMKEIRSDNPSIKLLNYMLTEAALQVGEDYEIKFYKDISELGNVEYKLMGSKQSLYISDSSRLSTYIDKPEMEGVMNYSDEYDSAFKRLGEIDSLKKFEEIKKEDNRNFLVSYLYCPIIQFNDVIGHIKIYTTYFSKKYIMPDQVRWFTALISLFNYGVTKSHILYTRYAIGSQETPIVNISVDGLLLELEDENLFNYLHYHRRIKMNIPIYENILEIHGEIIRQYETNNRYYMAVIFFKSKSEDMARLESFIYDESLQRIRG